LSAWEPHKIDLYYDRPRPALCLSSSEPRRRLAVPHGSVAAAVASSLPVGRILASVFGAEPVGKPRRMARDARRRLTEDDLLHGFDPTGPSRGHLYGFFITTGATSLYAWDLAFTFGAYHRVFYHRVAQILVLSMVVLIGVLTVRRQLEVRPWLLAAFALPFLWIVLQVLYNISESGPVMRLIAGVLIIANVLALPVIFWVIARLLAPDYFALPGRRLKVGVASTVAIVALTGYLVGENNRHFITCEEFELAGDDPPPNCVPAREHEPLVRIPMPGR
jgi:hypothetical protein